MLLYHVKGEIKNEKILYFLYTRNNKDAQVMAFGLQLFRSYIRDITKIYYIDSLKIDMSPLTKK